MNKTLHKKLIGKPFSDQTSTMDYPSVDDMLAGLAHEMNILREAAKDLLQPRPEAVANILLLARTV